ncbi:histidine phosphatase family protein [Alkalimonas collagenimarina]|uniref:Histidine phosphatase family protein n=1 Tax=Alkalimonas collagenimarina TaxID=400390 RepID=A0ABT9H1T3_9GAMM|nr:histidine phosphatase family protein [Alkalimonas collagenimarina]MDP4537024.1 histidine phosphatase family protein [Alkalimonas collagenimarina]
MNRTILLFCLLMPLATVADEAAWAAWRAGEAALLMRHALAPGTGDPAGFVLEDCSTQRNLNARGKQQARDWGQLLAKQHSGSVQLFSSQWCRCLETAELMAIAEVQPLPIINSFFAGRGDGPTQTQALRHFLQTAPQQSPIVLITHQVNITALTGISPASGEGILLSLPLTEPVQVLARIRMD